MIQSRNQKPFQMLHYTCLPWLWNNLFQIIEYLALKYGRILVFTCLLSYKAHTHYNGYILDPVCSCMEGMILSGTHCIQSCLSDNQNNKPGGPEQRRAKEHQITVQYTQKMWWSFTHLPYIIIYYRRKARCSVFISRCV